MYQPNEPIRGKYLVSMETKIAEEIEEREARQEVLHTRVHQRSESMLKRLQKAQISFFSRKTDRSVSKEIVAIQPNYLG